MLVYEYETLYTGGGMFMNNSSQEHRERIAARARDGWRFAGFVPTKFSGYGGIKELDLVFEKEVDG